MQPFSLTVLAAEKAFYEGDCLSLVIPTSDGQYGVQAQHSDMIAAIEPGELRITIPAAAATPGVQAPNVPTSDVRVVIAAVSEGIIKVENGAVLILVDTAERPEEIDEIRARHSIEQAKEMILQKKSTQDYYAAQSKMARAISRLRVKSHMCER